MNTLLQFNIKRRLGMSLLCVHNNCNINDNKYYNIYCNERGLVMSLFLCNSDIKKGVMLFELKMC